MRRFLILFVVLGLFCLYGCGETCEECDGDAVCDGDEGSSVDGDDEAVVDGDDEAVVDGDDEVVVDGDDEIVCDGDVEFVCEGCLIDDKCYPDGVMNPGNVCQICDVETDATGWADNDGYACDDELYCNGSDTCGEGTCSVHAGDPCDGGLLCEESSDSCVTNCDGCYIESYCYPDGTVNQDNLCEKCDVSTSVDSWSFDDGKACDDGEYCNGSDTCKDGACAEHSGSPCDDDELWCNGVEYCDEENDQCLHSLGEGERCPDDGYWCNGDESCDEDNDVCVHSTSKDERCPEDDSWCNGAEYCDEDTDSCVSVYEGGNRCVDDGYYCTGTESCDEAQDKCVSSGSPCSNPELCREEDDSCVLLCPGCTINDVCYGDGQVNPANVCQICNIENSSTAWSDNDVPCDDGTFCNGPDTCSEQTCKVHSGNPCPDDGLWCTGAESCNDDTDSCESDYSDSNPRCADDGAWCNGHEYCDDDLDECKSVYPGMTRCADDGFFCTGDENCNEANDICTHTGNPCSDPYSCDDSADGCVLTCTGCIIEGVCYGDGQANPVDACKVCNTSNSKSDWSNAENGTYCDDGLFCNSVDACLNGICTPTNGEVCQSFQQCDEDNDVCNDLLWFDDEYRYFWINEAVRPYKWQEAVNYCNTLDQAGYTDWHLASIDEIRTIVTNCPSTRTGGACPLSNDCANQSITCYTSDCLPACDSAEDHIDSNISNATAEIWTSTELSSDTTKAWYFYETSGRFYSKTKDDQYANYRVICVR